MSALIMVMETIIPIQGIIIIASVIQIGSIITIDFLIDIVIVLVTVIIITVRDITEMIIQAMDTEVTDMVIITAIMIEEATATAGVTVHTK